LYKYFHCFYQCRTIIRTIATNQFADNKYIIYVITLTWDPPKETGGAPIFEYKLWTQRGGSRRAWDEGERLLIQDYTTNRDGSKSYVENFNATTRLITNLSRDTLYRFMVSARNYKSTYGPPSLESFEVKTLAEKPLQPGAPTIPFVTDIQQTRLTVNWHPPLDDGGRRIKYFTVYKKEGSQANFDNGIRVNVEVAEKLPRVKDWQVSKTSNEKYQKTYSLSYNNLYSSNTFTFRISATNEIGVSPLSPISLQTQTLKAIPPTEPLDVQVVETSSSTFTVIWTQPLNTGGWPILRYSVEKRLGLANQNMHKNVEGVDPEYGVYGKGIDVGPTTSFILTNLKPEETYYIRVRAQNYNQTLGFGPYGGEVVGLTTSKAGLAPSEVVPGAVEKPTVSMYGYSKDSIHVSWNDPEATYGKPYSHYTIYVREITYDTNTKKYVLGHWKLAMEILATRRYYVHVNAKVGVTYQFAIAVKNNAGYGPISEPSSTLLVGTKIDSTGATVNLHNVPSINTHTTLPASFNATNDVNLTLNTDPVTVKEAIGATIMEDVMLINYQQDDYRGMDCAEMSMRQTHSGYVYDKGGYGGNIKYVTVEFDRPYDIPPDIEQLSHVDDCCGRTFELTVHSVWTHRFTVKMRRTDQSGGWNNVVVILWRAAAPAGYRCSVRGSLLHQTEMREHFGLRIVIIALEVHVVGDAMPIHRNVTIETDPRLKVVDPKTNALVPAKAIIRGKSQQIGIFHVFETSTLVIRNVQLRDGISGQGGCLYVSGAKVHLYNNIIASNKALQGGAIYMKDNAMVNITNCVFENNSALVNLWDGEALGGAIYMEKSTTLYLKRSQLSFNSAIAPKAAASGGALHTFGKARIDDCKFYKNRAEGKKFAVDDSNSQGNGGAISIIDSGSAYIVRSFFDYNHASISGGAFYSTGDISVYDTEGTNNTALMGSNVRVSLASTYQYYNSTFLRDDKSHYVETSEFISQSGMNVPLPDDKFIASHQYGRYDGYGGR
jgi:predicted outer membrane repeat protein